MNWEYVDRIVEIPKAKLVLQLLSDSTILENTYAITHDVSNKFSALNQFHEDLCERLDYVDLDNETRDLLVELIRTRAKEQREADRSYEEEDPGEMFAVMVDDHGVENFFDHEIVFHAFANSYICGDWYSNLLEYYGKEKTDTLFIRVPGLHWLRDKTANRRMSHTDFAILLSICDAKRERQCFLGLFANTD